MTEQYIEIVKKEINSSVVYFASECTGYVHLLNIESYDLKSELKRCTSLCKTLKEMGCKVSNKNGSRRHLKDNIEGYATALEEFNHNYGMVQSYANWITSKPLPLGTNDNEELNIMQSFNSKCEKALHVNTIIDRVNNFVKKLDEIGSMLEDEDFDLTKITF